MLLCRLAGAGALNPKDLTALPCLTRPVQMVLLRGLQ